ncbi:AmpG family muropeptide MFS transporter [Stenoxybacter acetivorans]|uniref:AmpG family muropeptide MFS transporter n=1 Tax=Stenoxybacter acetivorans TaxID=422441 RepID=UPI00068FA6A0|nr:AmpG family muropeptide MFS transporter [Stenoxybacter acetivorans]
MNIPHSNHASQTQSRLRQQIFSRRMLLCVFTGFTSGLPLYFLINLLPAWLRTEGVDLKSIGLFSLIGLPFTWKFMWSPLMDAVRLPFLGRRRGWMAVTQIMLLVLMALFALLDPKQSGMLWWIMGLALAVAFFSASQDIALDAFRREILPDSELGLGNAIHVNAYRIAALIPGSLSLVLADIYPWQTVFMITALFMLPGLLMTLFLAKEPTLPSIAPKTLHQTSVESFIEFFGRKGIKSALLVLLFIFLYKLGDSMATALATPFYLDMGYSKTDVGLIAKNAGLWPAVISGIVGGIWMLKIGINKALWLFGVVQVVTILGFVWLAGFGHFDTITATEQWMLAAVIAAEAVGVGLGTAAFVAYMARETNPAFTATQLALFTSLAAVPRTFFNSGTGYLIEWLGYVSFFWLCFALAIPGMLLLHWAAPWRETPRNIG